MAQMAKRHNNQSLTCLDDLAKSEHISANFLGQIITDLRRAGLIQSRRGKKGGYLLSREPDQISLADICVAVDGHVLELDLPEEGDSARMIAKQWSEVQQNLCKDLAQRKLTDLVAETESPMYYI